MNKESILKLLKNGGDGVFSISETYEDPTNVLIEIFYSENDPRIRAIALRIVCDIWMRSCDEYFIGKLMHLLKDALSSSECKVWKEAIDILMKFPDGRDILKTTLDQKEVGGKEDGDKWDWIQDALTAY